MATSSNFLSDSQFQCSICLDLFTEPVSTPCGHTFCKDCLTRYRADNKECQCPLCKNKFNKDLKLSVNTTFRELVENFKKHHQMADVASSVKPWEVSCDLCPVRKRRAVKTCLVCLASFCETHLEPHLRVAALQRHELSNPVTDLEERICTEHNRLCEFFCLNDHVSFCALCTEHIHHHSVNLNETRVEPPHLWRRTGTEQKNNHAQKAGAKGKNKGKGRRAENGKADQGEPPQHFNGCDCMFHNPGIHGGKALFEFQVNGRDGCDLAAVRESALFAMPFPPNWDNCCIARFRIRKNASKIMVVVDYDNGLIIFHDLDNDILVCKPTGSRFNEKIVLCFIPSQFSHLNWVKGLTRGVQKIPLHVQHVLLLLGVFYIITCICKLFLF
ncbi:E3 ubiquitin-protein ligase TRIM23-like [Fundulus heteroclitus]|uniref:E3 ubiquitin-protein ligase TRIM23-like n=1 Tax=Fundulus heteroclitus TaxID=8078 RepID=UPI00165CC1E7|nr:E3 ubiquitin-protein ligase TRIM23-like [Fundulus heteroclitus]